MPPHLDALAQEEWRDIVPQLRAIGVLSVIDGKALAAYCDAYARWARARQHIAKYGDVTGEGEHMKRNPSVLIAERAVMIMRAFLIEFGMTPSARARLEVGTPATPAEDNKDFFTQMNAQGEQVQ